MARSVRLWSTVLFAGASLCGGRAAAQVSPYGGAFGGAVGGYAPSVTANGGGGYAVPYDASGYAPPAPPYPAQPYPAPGLGVPPAPYGGGPYQPAAPYGPGPYGPSPYGPGPYPPPYADPYAPPPGALDLNAAPFDPPIRTRPDDPAFGPAMPRRPAPVSPAAGAVPFSPVIPPHRPLSTRDLGWTFIDAPEPREIMLHDIVTILVDEKSELLVQSRFNRQRNASFKAELKEFMRLDDDFNLAQAAIDGPTIDASLRGRLQSDGNVTDREGIRYRIAATVVGVLPNGNIVLEARKTIRSNDGVWEYTLTGTIASRDVKTDYTAISENIANLQIEKRQKGKVADSVQRPWGMWLYDKLSPF